jgi:flagellar motor switch protein FliN/FliY
MAMSQEEMDTLINSSNDPTQKLPDAETTAANSTKEHKTKDKNFENVSPKLELLFDLQLPVSIELGRTNMLIRDILQLGRGSVIEFDKLVSEPIDVIINGKKIAEGEVVVIDKHFGIRITQLIDQEERLKSLNT